MIRYLKLGFKNEVICFKKNLVNIWYNYIANNSSNSKYHHFCTDIRRYKILYKILYNSGISAQEKGILLSYLLGSRAAYLRFFALKLMNYYKNGILSWTWIFVYSKLQLWFNADQNLSIIVMQIEYFGRNCFNFEIQYHCPNAYFA